MQRIVETLRDFPQNGFLEIIPPSVILENDDVINWDKVLPCLERIVRTCYKSEGRIGVGSDEQLLTNVVNKRHLQAIEHAFVMSFRIVTSRGISLEAIRHRISDLEPSTSDFDLLPPVCQESQRYVNYGNKGYQAVYPLHLISKSVQEERDWYESISNSFQDYDNLIKKGWKPQEARDVLPNACKTEFIITFNASSLRHFFNLRLSTAAHPDMQIIAQKALEIAQSKVKVLFEL